MKNIATRITVLLLAGSIFTGCATMSKTGKGALFGTGGGAALGAGIGALAGGGKGAAIGAAVGAGVGAGAGALIGRKMDKQAAELERIQGAKVETTTDMNGLKAIRVTFEGGILFQTNKSDLSDVSKRSLTDFAASLKSNPDTDVTILGHTDNTGTLEVNKRISLQRAESVASYLVMQGVAPSRIVKVEGMAYAEPVADNATAAGRAANRRVEVYISAGNEMVRQAEAGTLK